MDMETDDALFPIAVLIDELKHDDTTLRLNAIRKLSTIAAALGPERSRTELVPFLDETIDDEDDILKALAEELGNLVDYIGGPQHAAVLLGPLENLAAVEDAAVRENAIASLCKLCGLLSNEDFESRFLPLVKKLSEGDWFTSRTSGAGLFACSYKRASPEIQADLRRYFHFTSWPRDVGSIRA
ncbi:MAG: armadillo-type protein [Olpidium bornovanus]|uniref:Armadillo-type protein n=1 Tax=Olpidium bornovanus TaxID=278681 RepID=A0A8H7ZQW3_9FUNG|nr:MAG: armadillo-type protein [Olpidium bornovanus]